MKTKLNHREAYLISWTTLEKVSFEIESCILGPFFDYRQARRKLLAIHSRLIYHLNKDIKGTFLGDNGDFSKIETDDLILQLELFSKTIFL